ncbi:MAG: hypothetical protein SGILL_005229, partial [Bacillariaceae sp.]
MSERFATFSSHSQLLSDSAGSATNIPLLAIGTLLLGGAAVFAYANIVYTPEIIEGASVMRRENREEQVQKLIEAVRSHINGDNGLEELRRPLEAALGVDSLEKYVASVGVYFESGTVDDSSSTAANAGEKALDLCEADKDLAELIKLEL